MFFRLAAPKRFRSTPLADSLPLSELRRLDQSGRPTQIRAGEELVAQSTPGNECFVVIDGSFTVEGNGFTGTVTDGELIGELALLTGRKRNASVVAASDSTIYALSGEDFDALLGDAPVFRHQVLTTASARLGLPFGMPPVRRHSNN